MISIDETLKRGCRPALLATILAGALTAATPVALTTNQHGTVGVAASTSQLLFTQPFCPTAGVQRGVYSVDSAGVSTLYALIPQLSGSETCTENYIALATTKNATAGFVAGTAYVTNGNAILVVPPGGGAATPMTITGAALSDTGGHSSVGFDQNGAFGFNLFYTSSEGVWKITSAGVSTKLANGIAPGTEVFIESPSVAPSNFGAHANQLFVTVEDDTGFAGMGTNAGVYYFNGSALVKFVGTSGTQAPESIQFVPATQKEVCSLTVKGAAYSGFLSVYSQATVGQQTSADSVIDGFSTADIVSAGLGNAIVSFEYANGATYNGTPVALADDMRVMNSGGTLSFFANVLSQLEGFNLITCAVPPPPPGLDGRMTGGGSVFTAAGDRVTHGFEIHCDVADVPNSLEVNWPGHRFHLTTLTSALCTKDPLIDGGHPTNVFNTYVGEGTGLYDGVPGAKASWTFTDAGEPGTSDTATYLIRDKDGNVVLTVAVQVLNKGNQQAHKDNK